MRRWKRMTTLAMAAALAAGMLTAPAQAAREARSRDAGEEGAEEYQAMRLLEKAQDLHNAGDYEQAQKMLENIVDKWPNSKVRFRVWLTMGKQAMDRGHWADAITAFTRVGTILRGTEKLFDEDLEVYLESLYLTGVAQYESSQYNLAFPVLRRITVQYPNSVWANQAYYYIGMCHFAKENWSRAIENLSRVGTLVDPDSPSAEYMEAARRFYIRIDDGDLPTIYELGQEVKVDCVTATGDKEVVVCQPLSSAADQFIGSIPTEISLPSPGDGKLQIWGHDTITTTYYDENTEDGEFRVPRVVETKVLSSGGITFTVATFDRRADIAYQDDNVYITVFDSDLDTSDAAETAEVRVACRYRKIEDQEELPDAYKEGVDLERIAELEKQRQSEESKYVIRDEAKVVLTEVNKDGSTPAPGTPVHTGFFVGSLPIVAASFDEQGNLADEKLSCYLDDEVIGTYVDQHHFEGDDPRENTATVKVAGRLTKVPTARQSFIADPVKRARKAVVEATAYLELGKIFADMGLKQGAAEKCDSGLELVQEIINDDTSIPRRLREESFKLKWELALTKEDLDLALATCDVFARLFPESEFVDQALIKIAQVQTKKKNYEDAMKIYNSIVKIPTSLAKAEALYRIGEIAEIMQREELEEQNEMAREPLSAEQIEMRSLSVAVPHYKQCAEQYPESAYAGEALAKVVDYYVLAKDYPAAEDLLDQIYLDYPDADFIPRMLLKWVLVSSRRGNLARAKQKCQELLFEHPQTVYAKKASQLLNAIDAQQGRTVEQQEGASNEDEE